ncbi:hypothetical protein [Nonomuraea angiospora]
MAITLLTWYGRRTEEKRKSGALTSCDISRARLADRENCGENVLSGHFWFPEE